MGIALITASFGTFRVARLIAEDDGPWEICKRFRARYTDETDWFARGIRCPICVGFWVSAVLTLYLALVSFIPWELWPICWFGVAGAAVKIKEFWNR